MNEPRTLIVRPLTPRMLITLFLALSTLILPTSGDAVLAGARGDYEGAAELGLALRKLGPTQRVLMVGAHPDDENTAILATLALGAGADVAYLSLTRGEGGQNGIGSELQEALGIIRTEELLAARRLDGARQYFSRAYDFGFSKSADEAFQHWPADSILADAVAVIREFRPDIVITIFTGTPADGHGQHQVAGIIARRAFNAAGDPALFPDQLERGLRPHRPARLYQALWRGGTDGLALQTGRYDPLLGYSYHQIALESRGRHRSQDMGRALIPGPQEAILELVEGSVPNGSSLFAGLDTTLSARARSLLSSTSPLTKAKRAPQRAGADGVPMIELLERYDEAALAVRRAFNPLDLGLIVPRLAEMVGLLEEATELVTDPELEFHLHAELEDLHRSLTLASGVVIDAVASSERITPGATAEIEVVLWNGGSHPIEYHDLGLDLPNGWAAHPVEGGEGTPQNPASDEQTRLEPGTMARVYFEVEAPADAELTEPYYLREPRTGDIYAWPDDISLRTEPFEPPALKTRVQVVIEGAELRLRREVEYRAVSSTEGESRRPVLIVPPVSIALQPEVAIVRTTAADREELDFSVLVGTDAERGISGRLRLEVPAGWRVIPSEIPITLEGAGERRRFEFSLRPPSNREPGRARVRAVFRDQDGIEYDRGYTVIDYPHIQPRPFYTTATSAVELFDVQVAEGLRVAYIPGAGDAIPEALAQLGVPVTIIDPADLATADLSPYQTVVLGIRAYEHQPELPRQNRRLLEFVEGGGTLIVQYNQYRFSGGGFAPYPLTIARPHDRVTDETAPVRLLDAEHPALSWPNRIGAADFEGWIQERGLYYAHEWDERYTPLLAMSDPGEDPLEGGLLVARYGKGTYVYTGIAFFRQLPAGVPGAYRFFANLVSLGGRQW